MNFRGPPRFYRVEQVQLRASRRPPYPPHPPVGRFRYPRIYAPPYSPPLRDDEPEDKQDELQGSHSSAEAPSKSPLSDKSSTGIAIQDLEPAGPDGDYTADSGRHSPDTKYTLESTRLAEATSTGLIDPQSFLEDEEDSEKENLLEKAALEASSNDGDQALDEEIQVLEEKISHEKQALFEEIKPFVERLLHKEQALFKEIQVLREAISHEEQVSLEEGKDQAQD
ncbi:hypothetical protein MMC12_008422 [Toensbergia leucococca]|nr:hypothetical protein [Toensbergia leucococca]